MKKIFLVLLIVLSFSLPASAQTYQEYIIIESINLYKSIDYLEITNRTWDTTDLNYGIARLEDTTWYTDDSFDETWGRTVLIGHSPGGFENLVDTVIGDQIIVDPGFGKVYQYVITEIYVTTPDDLTPIMPTSNHTLTLITCYGTLYRLIINARLD